MELTEKSINELTPKNIVDQLNRYIIGQDEAKKAVAIALRNRYRRKMITGEIRDEILPKNIILIGSTGIGKTEIARRISKLADAPFIKVEASKFTEVGYVGRDVESMVRDLLNTAISIEKKKSVNKIQKNVDEIVEEQIVDLLFPDINKIEEKELHENYKAQYKNAEFDEMLVEIDVKSSAKSNIEVFSSSGLEELGINIQGIVGVIFPGAGKKKVKKKVKVKDAKEILRQDVINKKIDMDEVIRESIHLVENHGIIFLDEIDKVASVKSQNKSGPDISREGVQRDLLPIIEGCTVATKYGPVKTEHVLFVAAGAFHVSKPSDLIPELQGRFPIRVKLKCLTVDDFKRILKEPRNALPKQYKALLEVENIELKFTDSGINKIAEIAFMLNDKNENIGARRLHTVLEKILEEVLFEAPDIKEKKIKIDKEFVTKKYEKLIEDRDLERYIL